MFVLIDSSPIKITFDPVATEERLPSVAFDITASWAMPFQIAQIEVKECWLEYEELSQFEISLKQLLHGKIENATVKNMSLKPIIYLEKNNGKFDFSFIAADLAQIGKVLIKTKIYEQELIEIIQNIQSWEKWW